MNAEFNNILGMLRHERGISQRSAATDLGVSQALLSHYENGIREPGLPFLIKACKYYGVSADYILGIDYSRGGKDSFDDTIKKHQADKNTNLQMLISAFDILVIILRKIGDEDLLNDVVTTLAIPLYVVYRQLLHFNEDIEVDLKVSDDLVSQLALVATLKSKLSLKATLDALQDEVSDKSFFSKYLETDFVLLCKQLTKSLSSIDEYISKQQLS